MLTMALACRDRVMLACSPDTYPPAAWASWVARAAVAWMSVARRLRLAVKMTDCPPGNGTAVSPALAPLPAEPAVFPAGAAAARPGRAAGAATLPPEVPLA